MSSNDEINWISPEKHFFLVSHRRNDKWETFRICDKNFMLQTSETSGMTWEVAFSNPNVAGKEWRDDENKVGKL